MVYSQEEFIEEFTKIFASIGEQRKEDLVGNIQRRSPPQTLLAWKANLTSFVMS